MYAQGKVWVLKFSGVAETRIGSNLEVTGLTMVLIGLTPSVAGVIDTEALFEAAVEFSPKSALAKGTCVKTRAASIVVKANINILFTFPPSLNKKCILLIYKLSH
jgi:hypothetical protein